MTGILWLLARRHVVASLTTTGGALLAVAFVVASLVLSDSLVATIRKDVVASYTAGDLYATTVDGRLPGSAADLVAAVPGVTAVSVDGGGFARTSAASGSSVALGVLADDPDLRWQQLTTGRWPLAVDEVVSADAADIGRTLTWFPVETDTGAVGEPINVTVVGAINLAPATAGAAIGEAGQFAASLATIAAVYPATTWRGLAIAVDGDQAKLTPAIEQALTSTGLTDVVVSPGSKLVAEEVQALRYNLGGLPETLLVLAGISLLVAVMVIATTHGVVMAQRTRQLALLRCLGASRRQLTVAGLVEAALVGLLAAVLGAAGGVGLAAAAVAIVSATGVAVPLTVFDVTPSAVLTGVVIGVVATVVAAAGPIRRAGRVAPVAALRPVEVAAVSRRASRARLVGGILLAAGGGAALVALAVTSTGSGSEFQYAAVCVLASFTGFILLSRPLAAAAVGAIQARLGRSAPPAPALGLAYAGRNAHRTGALTAALLVGVTLLATMTTGLASIVTSFGEGSGGLPSADVTVLTSVSSSSDIAAGISGAPDIEGTITALATEVEITAPGGPFASEPYETMVQASATTTGGGFYPEFTAVPPTGSLWLEAFEADVLGVVTGDTVRLQAGAAALDLLVDADRAPIDSSSRVNPADLAALGPATDARVLVAVADDTTAEAQQAMLAMIYDTVERQDPAGQVIDYLRTGERARQFLDQLLAVVGGLLGLSVLVATIGMAATFALSVHERGRDLALVRALGMNRREAAGIVMTEAATLGTVAAVLGVAVGMAYAIGAVMSLVGPEQFSANLPVLRLAVLTVLVVLAAVAAAVVPAYRSSRVAPAAGLTTFG